VFSTSPQVKSNATVMDRNSSLSLPDPLARHGVGPTSENASVMLNSPAPNTFTSTPQEMSMLK
jgi:hypothetical protein